jgi:hypothetical protein
VQPLNIVRSPDPDGQRRLGAVDGNAATDENTSFAPEPVRVFTPFASERVLSDNEVNRSVFSMPTGTSELLLMTYENTSAMLPTTRVFSDVVDSV